jgi:hypothetical protein
MARSWRGSGMDTQPDAADAPHAACARKPKPAAKALECLICRVRYSREDVLSGLYQLATKICGHCYGRMQASPHAVCCFGKPDLVQIDGTRLLGYSPDAVECRELCPDSAQCASVADPGTYNPPE